MADVTGGFWCCRSTLKNLPCRSENIVPHFVKHYVGTRSRGRKLVPWEPWARCSKQSFLSCLQMTMYHWKIKQNCTFSLFTLIIAKTTLIVICSNWENIIYIRIIRLHDYFINVYVQLYIHWPHHSEAQIKFTGSDVRYIYTYKDDCNQINDWTESKCDFLH